MNKQTLSPWKKLALTNEEIEGMPKDKIEVHLNEQVTTPMPWVLSWIGRHWKIVVTSSILIIILTVVTLAVLFKGEWFIVGWFGFVSFLTFLFTTLLGWALFTIPIMVIITMPLIKRFIKRDILLIVRYGSGRKKEYAITATEDGYQIGIPRMNPLGTLMFGPAAAKIDSLTWQYIQQNSELCFHDPLQSKQVEYRQLYVQPEERSGEPILKRVNRELVLNPKCLIRQNDAEELILHNIGKEKKEQHVNTELLYSLTTDLHIERDNNRKLEIRIKNVPQDTIREYIAHMCPETTEMFFDTHKLLKEKVKELKPFDSIAAELEAMSSKTTKGEE